MKDKKFRIFSCLLAALTCVSLFSCSFLADDDSSAAESVKESIGSVEESESSTADSSVKESSQEESSSEKENSEGGSSDGEEKEEEFIPNDPDPDKQISTQEIDELGHKIVYYTDGTSEDLGRAVPLNFATPLPQTQYNYQQLAKEEDGEGLCAFYEGLYERALAFHNSTEDLEMDEEGDYTLQPVNFSKHGISIDQAAAVWKVFGDENPVFYWLDINLYYSDDDLYLVVDPAYVTYSARKTAMENIQKMAYDCDLYLDGTTTVTQRALTIYDYLVDAVDYAYDEYGDVVEESWAYNIAGGATYGLGVCECYAETYAYFCGMFGIQCLNVVGMAGEANKPHTFGGHAWNYLNLEGKWYAVDITWADDTYLLREYFGQDLSDYNATHELDLPVAEWGTNYQCAMPTLSGSLCPVLLGKEGEKTEMVASIDEAFAKMTDEQGSYEVTLYPHTAVTEKNSITIYPYNAKIHTASLLPKVEKITFIGEGEYQTELLTANTVTLQCNVVMKNVEYTAADWIKGDYKITSK